MGFIKRKVKKFDYQPRYYKGKGNPYEISHKFDQFRTSVGGNKGIKNKLNNALNDLKGAKNTLEIDDEVYEVEDKSNSSKMVLYIIMVLVLIFLFIIDFDLSIFLNQ